MITKYRDTEIVRHEIRTITPEEADTILSGNEGNRNISQSKAREYARYMRDGSWRMTGQALVFSEDGNLIDGQHRLLAVNMAGRPQQFLVVVLRATDNDGELTAIGLPLDLGKKRTIADITGIDRKAVEIARALIRDISVDGKKKAQDPEIVARVTDDLWGSIQYVQQRCSTARKTFSQAIIRGTIALRHAQGYDHTEMYHNTLTSRVDLLNLSWSSWVNRISALTGGLNEWTRLEMLCATWAVTEPGRDMTKKLVYHEKTKPRILEDARSALYDLCFSSLAKE